MSCSLKVFRPKSQAVTGRGRFAKILEEESPEQILPPTSKSTPNTVVRAQPVYATHVLVVVKNADRHRHIDELSVASCWPHNVLPRITCRDHVNISLVVSFQEHDAVIICPLDRFTLLKTDASQRLRELSPRCTCPQVPQVKVHSVVI